jgi:DNA polymerase III epsilon subunit-like protein
MDGSPKFLQDYTSKSVEFIRGHSKQVHGITDTMVRGQPTREHVLPQFIEFLGESDTILLAHNAPFDLGFLAMALTRLGIACPSHYVFDTLEMARRLYPAWHSHSLENVAARLKIANGAEHRSHSGVLARIAGRDAGMCLRVRVQPADESCHDIRPFDLR